MPTRIFLFTIIAVPLVIAFAVFVNVGWYVPAVVTLGLLWALDSWSTLSTETKHLGALVLETLRKCDPDKKQKPWKCGVIRAMLEAQEVRLSRFSLSLALSRLRRKGLLKRRAIGSNGLEWGYYLPAQSQSPDKAS